MNPTPNGYLNSTMSHAARAPSLDEVEEQEVSSGDTSASPHKKKGLHKGKGKATGHSHSNGNGNGNSHGGGKGKATDAAGKAKGKFFVQSSPSRASVSDSSAITSVSPVNVKTQHSPIDQPSPAKPAPSLSLSPQPPQQQQIAMRRSSGSSTGASKKKRHVSLSTMKGKFHAEKRKAAAALEAKEAREEDGGWEDDEEDLDEWSDDEVDRSSMTAASPKEIPPPAPTPLVRMSKKQREAAKAERAQIEAELEAQRKREMFAKQQIFGQPRGLLSQALQRGGSLVDLPAAAEQPHSHSALSSSKPTHKTVHAHTLGQSPGPSLLRSKSAVAIPVQTGVSVTVSKPLSRPITNQESDPPPLLASKEKAPPALSNRARILPPSEEQLETTDEESQDDTLANENTKQKLAQLVQRKEAAKVAKSKSINSIPSGSEENRSSIPIAMATSPTTDRRAMITRELSESLRKSKSLINPRTKLIPDLILERQKSSTSLSTYRHAHPHIHQPDPTHPRPSALGRGLLRPLTRTETSTPTRELSRAKTSANLHRPQSSADLTLLPESAQPPPMTRSNTLAGHAGDDWQERRAEIVRRTLADDTGYRSHGW